MSNKQAITPRWFRPFQPAAAPNVRLFCFPYAGSGPSIFREWPEYIDTDIEVTGILYPGRESRVLEPLMDDIIAIAESLMSAIVPHLNRPFAFFGHSMGALIAFELVRMLDTAHDLAPEHLFVSAAGAPHLPTEEPIHHLPGPEFLDALVNLNGMPQEVLQNTELLEYALPIIRNDFAACANYQFTQGAPVRCPVTAFGGSHDPLVDPEHIQQWEQYTSAEFDMEMLQGDHFFLQPWRERILKSVSRQLTGARDSLAAGG